MEFYNGDIPIFDDATDSSVFAAGPTGHDPAQVVREMFAAPSELDVIPQSEWDARYDEQETLKSSLEHLYLRGGKPAFVNLDQNGNGYCWAYSTGHALMMCRLRDNDPLVRLNPHSVAAIIKKGRDEGGWCGLSAKFVREFGMAPEGDGAGQWPLHSRNTALDTPAMRSSMALYASTEEWMDLARNDWDHKLSLPQLATCLFNNSPCPTDFNWWGHSVCSIRWVRIESGSWGPLILNSWKGWGRDGLAVLRGSKGKPDGALSIRTVKV